MNDLPTTWVGPIRRWLSGLVVGRASYGGVSQAAGPASATDRHHDAARYTSPQALMCCAGTLGGFFGGR